MKLNPYLFFTGNCAEAMEFYKSIFGGELKTMPNEGRPGLMHADLTSDDITILATDGMRTSPYETSFVTLSLNGSDSEKITAAFNALAEGGEVTNPLKTEVWGDTFGMLTDKFGVDWMVNINAK
jgi:PhnB protein